MFVTDTERSPSLIDQYIPGEVPYLPCLASGRIMGLNRSREAGAEEVALVAWEGVASTLTWLLGPTWPMRRIE